MKKNRRCDACIKPRRLLRRFFLCSEHAAKLLLEPPAAAAAADLPQIGGTAAEPTAGDAPPTEPGAPTVFVPLVESAECSPVPTRPVPAGIALTSPAAIEIARLLGVGVEHAGAVYVSRAEAEAIRAELTEAA